MPSSEPLSHGDLEIRIFEQQHGFYPVELTLDNGREFPRGYLDAGAMPQTSLEDEDGESGEVLYNWLCGGDPIRSAWEQVRHEYPNCRIRLRIDAAAPQLHALCWERLRETPRDGTATYLAAAAATPFSRYLAGTWQPGNPIQRWPIRILVAISNPIDAGELGLTPLEPEEEWENIQRATQGLEVELTLLAPCTLAALEEALGQGYHVLHFIGHGGYSTIDRAAAIVMTDAAGRGVLVRDQEFAEMVRRQSIVDDDDQDYRLRLVFLQSCQTATRDSADPFRGFAPSLVRAGVPAVMAMQDRISIETGQRFTHRFYTSLLAHGAVDRACNEARSTLLASGLGGAFAPVLFMRMKNGRIWYRAGSLGDEEAMWQALLSNLGEGTCTPILGPDFHASLLGTRRQIAQRWAETYRFPMASSDKTDLARVAQFLAVQQGARFPRQELVAHLRTELIRRFGATLTPAEQAGSLDSLIVKAGHQLSKQRGRDPHAVLAQLPVDIFVTTNPSSMLTERVRAAGKDPVVEICRWNRYVERIPSILATEPDYAPSIERPLVFQLFGSLEVPESVVLTEDDYFDYLMGVVANKEIIPSVIRSRLANSALLFLGFRMEEWSFRVLFRSIMNREGAWLLDQYRHVAVQINPDDSSIQDLDRARKYLESYFGKANVNIFWCSVEDFVAELWRRWQNSRP